MSKQQPRAGAPGGLEGVWEAGLEQESEKWVQERIHVQSPARSRKSLA